MQQFWDSGIQFIVSFQAFSWLITPMKLFSFMGSELFYIFLLPVIYWSIDSALGLRIGFILLFNTWLNEFLKILFHDPRPYWYSTEVKAYASEISFGLPSGHAQTAVAVWGMIAYYVKRPWVWVVSVALMILIGLSRIFLGVHFPTDVLAGWLIGGILLFCFIKFWDPVAAWLNRLSFAQQILVAFLVSMGFIGTMQLAIFLLGDWKIPQEWLVNAAVAFPDGPAPDPLNINTVVSMAGILFGLSLGLAWTTRRGGFSTDGTFLQRCARILIGLIGLLILYVGLKLIFPSGKELLPTTLRYLRYGLVGAWVSAGAPWLFIRMKLAKPRQDSVNRLSYL
jgi:membrane-associated phospholipid phosphatase